MSEYARADARAMTGRQIQAADTAVAAFVGRTVSGPTAPTAVRSWSEFAAVFGGGAPGGLLADAVSGFFVNGGSRAYVRRLAPDQPAEHAVRLDDYTAAIDDLGSVDEITIVCVPEVWADTAHGGPPTAERMTAHEVQRAVIAHCERLGDRLAILDAPPGLNALQALVWRVSTAGYDSAFAVLYYPWLKIFDEAAGAAKLVPPCGHLAGVWARVDATRGVHKAATNEVVRGVIGVGAAISRSEHELLDPAGVNCVRAFLGRGVRVWGSRTLSSDPSWQEITARRVVSHIEASLRRATQQLGEHSGPDLVRSIRTYLFQTLLTGALVGESVTEAFRVELLEARDGGAVCEVGIAPRLPGEFVTFRVAARPGGRPEVSE